MMDRYRRQSDPPDGSYAARWSDALRPWLPLITGALAVWSVASAIMLAIGFSVSTPAEAVDRNSARITAIETSIAADRARMDRLESLTMALVQSKCLELDAGSQAISVLPCRALGVAPASAGRPAATPAVAGPDWHSLLSPPRSSRWPVVIAAVRAAGD